MSEYYAVQRSEEYLEHYGVRGMKWGVRKAIQSGNTKALGRHYMKAQKKLAKLERNASIKNLGQKYNMQRTNQKQTRRAGIGLAAAGAGIGAAKVIKGLASGAKHITLTPGLGTALALTAASAGLASKTYKARAKRLADKMSPEGQKAEKAKIKEFKSEMNKAFKGANQKALKQAQKNYNAKAKRSAARKQALKDGLKSAALSTVMGPAAASVVATRRAANEIPARNARHKPKRR